MSNGKKATRILIIDAKRESFEQTHEALAEAGGDWLVSEHASTLGQSMEIMRARRPDAILIDWSIYSMRAENLLRLREACPRAAVIVMAGVDDTMASVKAIRLGAEECVIKGQLRGRALKSLVRTSIERHLIAIEMEASSVRTQEELRRMAIFDELTGVYNLNYGLRRLYEEMERSSRYGSPLSLLMFEVLDIRRINEAHGELYADQVLMVVAKVIEHNVRRIDLVCRHQRGRFVLMLVESDVNQAGLTANRILDEVNMRRFEPVEGEPFTLNALCGIVQYDRRHWDPHNLMNCAEEALCRAVPSHGKEIQVWRPS